MGLKRIEFVASTAYTAAEIVVSDWVDVGEYSEGYFWLDVTVFAARADETLDVVIERYAGNTAGYTTIATFTQVATTGAKTEEELVTASMGGRIRARATVAGTFSSKSITFSVKGEVKQV
jgi:hypothetical protein